MATWQFSLYIIPEAECEEALGALPTSIPLDRYDAIDRWCEVDRADAVIEALSTLLPQRKSWSRKTDMFGDEDGNDIHLLYEGPRLGEVFVRIDLREIAFSFIETVVRIAREQELVFFIPNDSLTQPDNNGRLMRPELDMLIEAIRESSSFRFVQDPHGYFDELSRKKTRDE